MIRTRTSSVAALALTAALIAPVPSLAQTAPKFPIDSIHVLSAIPVRGTVANGGTFVGTLDLARFVVNNGQLQAIGTLSGKLRDSAGNLIGTVRNVLVQLDLAAAPRATCQILHLELGPLDLDLLGLQVHLNKVVLDITAQTGNGQLLGNLLCGLANLLNNGSPVANLAEALNDLLRLLN